MVILSQGKETETLRSKVTLYQKVFMVTLVKKRCTCQKYAAQIKKKLIQLSYVWFLPLRIYWIRNGEKLAGTDGATNISGKDTGEYF